MTQTGFGASRAIVFGGSASEAALFRDAHYLTYTRTSWTWDAVEVPEDAAPELPASRRSHAAMWDDVQRRLVVYGGVRGSTVLSDLWELRVR